MAVDQRSHRHSDLSHPHILIMEEKDGLCETDGERYQSGDTFQLGYGGSDFGDSCARGR